MTSPPDPEDLTRDELFDRLDAGRSTYQERERARRYFVIAAIAAAVLLGAMACDVLRGRAKSRSEHPRDSGALYGPHVAPDGFVTIRPRVGHNRTTRPAARPSHRPRVR